MTRAADRTDGLDPTSVEGMDLPDSERAHPDPILDGARPIDASPTTRADALKAVVELLKLRALASKPEDYQPVGLGVVLGLAEHTTRWLVSGVRPPPIMPGARDSGR